MIPALVKTEFPELRRIVWDAEKNSPLWFQQASAVWHPTYEAFSEFWENCGEIWAFADKQPSGLVEFKLLVYLEFLQPHSINIHVSVIAPIAREKLTESLKWLKDKKASDGVTTLVGWLLDKNRGMRKIAEEVGFRETGAKMDYGVARGRVLRWRQYRA